MADAPGTHVNGRVGETACAEKQPRAHEPQFSSSDREVSRLAAIQSMARIAQRGAQEGDS